MTDTTNKIELINPLQFMLSGKAIFICHNIHTDNKYKYKVYKADHKQIYYVSVYLNGEYNYIGIIKLNINNTTIPNKPIPIYIYSNKSNIPKYSASIKGFDYIITHLVNNNISSSYKFYHVGKCGRCGRPLTTKESIQQGYGAECIKHV